MGNNHLHRNYNNHHEVEGKKKNLFYCEKFCFFIFIIIIFLISLIIIINSLKIFFFFFLSEIPKKKKCKLQKYETPLRPSNVNVEIRQLFETSVSDKPISRPYDWPNPVPYSRAIIRMSQIREFILTHCPKAVAVGMDIDDSSEPKPKSLQMAEDLWKKLDLLEQKYSQQNQV